MVFATSTHDATSSVFLTPPLSDKPKKTATMRSQNKDMLVQNLMLTPTSPEQLENDTVTRRHPLASHNCNVPLRLSSPQKVTTPSIPAIKQTKCPFCSSTAKEYSNVYAECCSCGYSFCPSCFEEAHTDNKSCCKRIQSSPTKEEFSQLDVGTAQSKERLRRLF